MITRAQWGAAPTQGSMSGWGSGQPTGIAIHYVGGSGWIGLSDHDQCFAMMRSIQNYAMNGGNGWTYSDIEYNLAACPHGEVFEGRGLHLQGAAQKGANASHLSVLVLANVKDTITGSPLAAATNAAVALAQQTFPTIREVCGHRDTAGNPTGTNCPGDLIEQWINAGRPGGTVTEAPDLTPEESAMLKDVHAALPLIRDTFALLTAFRNGWTNSGEATDAKMTDRVRALRQHVAEIKAKTGA